MLSYRHLTSIWEIIVLFFLLHLTIYNLMLKYSFYHRHFQEVIYTFEPAQISTFFHLLTLFMFTWFYIFLNYQSIFNPTYNASSKKKKNLNNNDLISLSSFLVRYVIFFFFFFHPLTWTTSRTVYSLRWCKTLFETMASNKNRKLWYLNLFLTILCSNLLPIVSVFCFVFSTMYK